jgi:hypothetical protein
MTSQKKRMCCSLRFGEHYAEILDLPFLFGQVLGVQVEKASDSLLLLD